jgi:hypothetical protein
VFKHLVSINTQALHRALSSTTSTRHTEPTNAYSAQEYAYCRALVDGVRQRETLAAQEAETRRRREARFPASVAEYRTLRETDGEQVLRVARFLAADKGRKEEMMERYGWAYRQVRPLEEAYTANVSICARCRTGGVLTGGGDVPGGVHERSTAGAEGVKGKLVLPKRRLPKMSQFTTVETASKFVVEASREVFLCLSNTDLLGSNSFNELHKDDSSHSTTESHTHTHTPWMRHVTRVIG